MSKFLRHNLSKRVLVILGVIIAAAWFFFSPKYGYRVAPSPGFEEKVALARQENLKINFGEVIKEETRYYSTGKNNRKLTCVRGSYSTADNPEVKNGVRCEKGYAKYMGINNIDEKTLKSFHATMLKLGWHAPYDWVNYDEDINAIVRHEGSRGTLFYKNKDGLTAYLSFAPRNANWGNCVSYPICKISHDRKAQKFQAIVSSSVTYKVDSF